MGASTTINSLNVIGNGTNRIAADNSTLTINANGDSNTSSGAGESTPNYTGNPAGQGISISSAANAFTINAPIMLGASQTWTNNSANLFTAGGNVTGTAVASTTQTFTLTNTGAGNTLISGTIGDGTVGGNLALVVNGSSTGAAILSGPNTYSGGTTIGSGATLQIGNGGTTGSFGSGSVTDSGALNFYLTASSPVVVSTTISGSGNLSLLAGNTSTIVLTANNSYNSTTIGGGTLQVGSGGTTGSLGTGSIVDNGALVYILSSSNTVALPAGISGTGSLAATVGNIQFNGNITLGGSQSYTQNSGAGFYTGLGLFANTTLTSTGAGAAISLSGDVGEENADNQYSLAVNTNNGPINLNISLNANGVWYSPSSFSANAGTGAINVTGTGPSGGWRNTPVTLTGAVNITANVNSTATNGVAILPNGTTTGTVSGSFSGTMPLTVVGPGTLTLNGPNSYSGLTSVVLGGTLVAGNTQSLALGKSSVALDGGTLSLQSTSSLIIPVQQTLRVSGYNAGIIVPASAATATAGTTGTFDGQWNFFQQGFLTSTEGITVASGGTFTSAANSNVKFTFGTFGTSNVLLLSATGSAAPSGNTGTLTLATPTALSSLNLLDADGNGGTTLSVTLNFFGGGSDTIASGTSVQDWFGGSNVAIERR